MEGSVGGVYSTNEPFFSSHLYPEMQDNEIQCSF